ncbi:DUF2809 domain-containing protein [Flaviramulus sp. BrNp1-15]|uniref:ribosomal maturation YjgA family protein n=1 Tax=Flaviramulus sp. BrNp1-15 TaxID=2916754 RepID=UPI001EE97CEB|nr:DUF2809 domain-containing protein [Flaviramulus sp. BrNp1-15]ULC59016.1 DUF2809 domain-containing protein [Flaviramulus sp. BrNp1-15]
MNLKFNKTYLIIIILLFITEVLIAVYLKSGFIRHTFGDYLAVILVYSFIKSFIKGNHFKIAISVLVFAFFIEFLQLVNILEILHLQNNHLIKIIIGSTFHISDLVAYTFGIITVLITEFKIYKLWIT